LLDRTLYSLNISSPSNKKSVKGKPELFLEIIEYRAKGWGIEEIKTRQACSEDKMLMFGP